MNDSTQVSFSTSLPNIKIGYHLNERLALLLYLPGSTFKYQNKVRGFEGLLIVGQYWVQDKWWLLAGAGLTFDAPAFYTVKDPSKAIFHTGFPAFTFATGYEVWRTEKFGIDLQ